ncbi:MAG: hypothetical protein KDA22_09380, partial [Phycisphaerales bacterium]|nr:hypothetical protein [Phycisphaerales bacterium]
DAAEVAPRGRRSAGPLRCGAGRGADGARNLAERAGDVHAAWTKRTLAAAAEVRTASLRPVNEAAIATQLPQTMLREMAADGRIPFMKQGRKRLFDPQQVLAAVFAEADRRTDADRIDGIVGRAVARRRGLPPLDPEAIDFMKQGIRPSPREIADLELAADVLGVQVEAVESEWEELERRIASGDRPPFRSLGRLPLCLAKGRRPDT